LNHINKTKTFIAFINKDGKDKWWLHGNYCFDEETPKIYPYETKQEKSDAIEIGKRLGVWSETSDIEGVLLKVVGEPFSIITKKEASVYHVQLQKEEDARVAERKAKEESEKKPKKEPKEVKEKVEKVEKEEVVVDRITPTIVPTPIISKPKVEVGQNPEPKRRGRPKISFED